MTLVSAIEEWFSDLVRDVFRTFRLLNDSREQQKIVAKEQSGVGFSPDEIARIADLELIEDKAQFAREALNVLQAVHASIAGTVTVAHPELSGPEKVDLAFEIMWRMFLPAFTMAVRRGEKRPIASMILDAIALGDEKVAENASGFTGGRLLKFFQEGYDKDVDGQPGRLLFPQAIPLVAFIILKKFHDIAPHYDVRLNAGWESHYLDRAYGRAESWRPTPAWIAQRTTSIHVSPPQPFKMARYYNAEPQPEPELFYGITCLPVPKKREWTGDPSHAPALIADLKGPAMFVQFDVSGQHTWTRKNWTLELRGGGDHGVEWPIGGDAAVDYAVGGGGELELRWTSPPLPPGSTDDRVFSAESISVLNFVGGGVTTNGYGRGDAGIGLRVSKARLTLQPDGGVLKAVLREPLTLNFDGGLMMTTRGLVLEGANGLDLVIPFKKPAHSPLALSYVRLSAIYEHKQHTVQAFGQDITTTTTEIGGQVTAGLQGTLGGVTLILDGIGVKAVASTSHPGGNLAGVGHADVSLVKPSGLGIKIDWGTFAHGGGFLSHDEKLDRYAGALEIGFGQDNPTAVSPKPWFVLRGVGFCEPERDASGTALDTTTMLALATGEFAKWGIGALVAVHRGMDLDALRTGMVSGAADALLFPQDPLANAPSIIASLATMFPAATPQADKHVLGLLGKLSWAAGFATITAGLLAEWSGGWKAWPDKVALPFSLRVGKTGSLARYLWIEVDGVGSYDQALDEWELHAELHNSRLFGGDFVGGLTLFHGDPIPDDDDKSHQGFVSLGGYHPSYYAGKGPGRASVARRLGIVLTRGNLVRFEVQFYCAYSPCGFQFGISGHLVVDVSAIKLDGKVWIDGLFHSWDSFILDLGGSVALILFDQTITELKLEGQLFRTDKLHFAGAVSFKVLWWTVTKHTKTPLSDGLDCYGSGDEVHKQLADAVAAAESYPNVYPGHVTLTGATRTGIWNAPEQPLSLIQKVVPLDMPIARFGSVTLAPNTTFTVGPVSIAGVAQPAPPYTRSEFSPGAFLDLDTDAALHAPAAELWPAGFAAGDDIAVGDDIEVTAKVDEITIDRAQLQPMRTQFEISTLLVASFQQAAVVIVNTPIKVLPARFAARVGDAPTTFGAAWATRGITLRRTEGLE